MVGAAEDEDLDQLVEDEAVGGIQRRWQPSGWGASCAGSNAATRSQMGSMMDDGMAGTGTLLTRKV